MKKIKKMVAMLMIVAMMFGGMVLGADPVPVPDTSKSFEIKTTIPAMAELKIHQTSGVNTIAGFNSITIIATEHAFVGLDIDAPDTVNSGDYYLSVKTNAKSATSIKALFTVMAGTTLSGNTLDYTLKYGSSATKASSMSVTPIVLFTIPAANGARVFSNSFSIDILGSDIKTAVPDSYSATITFEYATT